MSSGQRATRTVALSGHGHERSDAVGRLFFDRFVFGLRGPRERGHGAPVARHRLRVDARQWHVLRKWSGIVVSRQQQSKSCIQSVRVATPLVQRSTRFHVSAFVVCSIQNEERLIYCYFNRLNFRRKTELSYNK